ncbi:biotin--[acetyl-CoA-carboxylase] ligase [Lactococcus nasutitermitis]|uniref:biotin--[biotin carboxyl-carrier protein] ligase n=1 Tax=Lactococcus nasutitermitis TaxID=1652957 RepID=A0ABV9JA52_9LACT|nr:biotin--[acetyl-CoA-carboxylase] ligase [Lactococcus nasutitermitis]
MEKLDKDLILMRNPWLTDVKITEESVSTQMDAKADNHENTLYMTENQLGTYGRFGRRYFATDTGGIYMSLLLKASSRLSELPEYTLLTAAAIVTAIEKLTNKQPQIKWVNDIYLDNKKFVGILAESSVSFDSSVKIIIGVGINFSITDFPIDLREKATSLFTENPPTISRSELVAEILSEFHRLENDDFYNIYKAHSFILGKQVEFEQNGIHYEGQAVDLTENGELIVHLLTGEEKILSSGEISLKKWT